MTDLEQQSLNTPCDHCEGKGYIEIRDCSGEIQRSETCVFCDGTGTIQQEELD
jgi:DnaJ-class molecular chaperone